MQVKKRLAAAGTAGLLVTVMAFAVPGADASSSGSGLTAVSGGINAAAVPGAKVFGTTPPNTPETVSFVLTERNLISLESAVESGMASSSYRSLRQFASTYGQTAANITRLQSYLAGYGIDSTVYPDEVDVVANGRAGQFNKALGVTQSQYKTAAVPGKDGRAGAPAQSFHGTSQSPLLPSDIAKYVTAVLGLTNYGPFTSTAVHVVDTANRSGGKASPAPAASPSSGTTAACLAATGLPEACHLPSDFAKMYGLDPMYKSGDGAGSTIGIVTLASLDPGAPEYFWQNVAGVPTTGRTLTTVDIDGGSGAPSDSAGTGETDLDVEQSGAIAPGANLVVYQAPNTDYGFADAFFDAASQNVADDVSTSWGESETIIQALVKSGQESSGYAASLDEAFLELAAQGQSAFAASGDEAAYDASRDIGTTNLSVDNPADSPFITAAGGTTLPWSGTLTGPSGSANVHVGKQRAWGWDYLWQPTATINGQSLADAAESLVVGSGGGFSALEPTPSFQDGVSGTSTFKAVQYLTPTDYQNVDGITEPTAWKFNPTPTVKSGTGTGRAVPDLSTNADPYTGYLLYEPSFAPIGEPELQGGWGGTSFVAPQLNATTAVIDSVFGHRVGLWNPAIYAAATSNPSPFTSLQAAGTNNDNIYYTGNPGTVYNQATGLGIPNLAEVATSLGVFTSN